MTTAKKIHTNLAATACLNLPPSGTVMWGRIKYSDGKALRVDGYTEGGMVIVSHHEGKTVDMLPATLIHAYREANSDDPFVAWPDSPPAASGDMVGKAATVKNGKPRKPAAKRTEKRRATECDAPTILATPAAETAAPQSPVMMQPSNDAPTSPGLATTSAPARIPHFGPEPLPSAAHKVMELEDGKTVRVYLSNRDGSAWGVVRDLAKVLHMDQDKITKRAADPSGERAVKAEVRSSQNRVLPIWLARLDIMGSWLHPARDEDVLVKTRREQADKFAKPDAVEEQAAPPAPEQPAEDDADGDVPDGVAIVRVDGVSLVAPGTGEADHKIRDVDLARFIGYGRLRKFRETIAKYENSGDLNGVDWRPCEGRQLTNGSGVRIFKVKSAFLTMDQALFVVAKSDSPSANTLTRHIISVFLKVQRQGGAVTAAPSMDQMMAAMAQIATRTATEAARETVSAMLAEFRKTQPAAALVDDKVQQDAETLRRQRANAARKGAETRDFNEMFRNVRDVLTPLVYRFSTERLVRADTRNNAELARCLRPSEVRIMFEAFLKANDKRISLEEREALDTLSAAPDTGFRDRSFYCLFNEMSGNVKVQRTIVDDDGETVTVSALPWYPKVALASDPRQTKIPGTGG